MLLTVRHEGIDYVSVPEAFIRYIFSMRPLIELPNVAFAPGEIP